MAMIDIGVEVLLSTTDIDPDDTAAVDGTDIWEPLADCLDIPQMIQKRAMIDLDVIGADTIRQLKGKRTTAGSDFLFAYNGAATGTNFRTLKDLDINNEDRWIKVKIPHDESTTDVLELKWKTKWDVTDPKVTPSGVTQFTATTLPQRVPGKDLIQITLP